MTREPLDPVPLLAERFRDAIRECFPQAAGADPLVAPARNPSFGDFQCNAAMPLGKALGKPPREIAAAIAERVDLAGIAEPLTPASIAGPGFINVTLSRPALAALLERLDTPALGLPAPARRQTIVVDLFGVNLAKQMQVWHLRSTVIGDAIARTLERLGHRVVRQNHLGDWGLQIAMVTARLLRLEREGAARRDTITLDDLDAMYKAAQRECAADEEGLAAARRWHMGPKVLAELGAQVDGAREALGEAKRTLVALQSGDAGTRAAWEHIARITVEECLGVARRLRAAVTAEATAGESSYRDELAGVVEDFVRAGLARLSDGALVVDVEGVDEPLILRKSDGGFLYATTDLAAIRRRVGTIGAERVIYAVDARQSLHFRQVFGAARAVGYTRLPAGGEATLEHAAFGTMLGEDGRPFKSRSGESVKLADILDEAVGRAERAVAAKNPAIEGAERRAVAEAVAVAAMKYADLATERTRDYVFSLDRMLAFEGNTGPYLLYALVRIRSIFRKAQERALLTDGPAPIALAEPAEKALALALLRYPGTVESVGASLEPHRLCQFLFDLATAFSAFFDACPVLQADDPGVRASRLRLCRLTERVLVDGLALLGIEPVERM